MQITVLDCGPLVTIQDAGRWNNQRLGVPVSGAMDWFAFKAANALVGNPLDWAAIEIGLGSLELIGEDDRLVAVTGVGYGLIIENCGRSLFYPAWMATTWRAGELLRVLPRPQAGWGYLAISGGINVEPVMGSRSTYLRGGFGGWQGRALQPGDRLPLGELPPGVTGAERARRAGLELPANLRPAYTNTPFLGVIPGPHLEAFSPAGLATFLHNPYRVTDNSDRMGYRLQGPLVTHRPASEGIASQSALAMTEADVLSEGLPLGAVQVPADGQPIIALADRQTTGGYTRLGTICLADLPLLAQLRAPWGRARFYEIDLEIAQERFREMNHILLHVQDGSANDPAHATKGGTIGP